MRSSYQKQKKLSRAGEKRKAPFIKRNFMIKKDMKRERLWTKDYLLSTLINFLILVNYYLLMVMMTDYACKQYGVSLSTAGLTASIFVVGALLSRLFTGAAMEKVGRTRILHLFLILNLLMSLAYFLTAGIAALLLIRILHGISYGAISTAVGTIVSRSVPKSRTGEGIGYYMLSVTLAAAVGPFLGMSLHGSGGFTLLFGVCCGLTAAALAASLFITPQPPETKTASASEQPLRLSSFFEPKAFRVSSFAAAVYFGYSALLAFLTTYTTEAGLASTGRFFFVVYAIAIFVSRPVTGPLFDKKGEAAVLIPAFLSFTVGMALLGFMTDSATLLTAAAFLGFGVGVTQSTGLASAVREAPKERMAVVNSTFYIFLDTAVGLGPFIMGFVLPFIGNSYPHLYCGLALLSLVMTLIYLPLRPKTTPHR